MKKTKLLSLISFLLFSYQSFCSIDPFGATGREGAVSFVINDTVYVGLGKDESNYYNDFWKYSETSGQWQKIADFPGDARAFAQAFVINATGYVGTGEYYKYGVADTVYQDFFKYNPENNTWTKIKDFGGGCRSKAVSFVLNNITVPLKSKRVL